MRCSKFLTVNIYDIISVTFFFSVQFALFFFLLKLFVKSLEILFCILFTSTRLLLVIVIRIYRERDEEFQSTLIFHQTPAYNWRPNSFFREWDDDKHLWRTHFRRNNTETQKKLFSIQWNGTSEVDEGTTLNNSRESCRKTSRYGERTKKTEKSLRKK